MDIQLKKGFIEAYVLHLLMKEPTYAYKLYSQINENALTISENTLYPIFKRLERDGLVITFNEEHNGRLRKYYRITQEGNERLTEFIEMFSEMKQIMDQITKGVIKND